MATGLCHLHSSFASIFALPSKNRAQTSVRQDGNVFLKKRTPFYFPRKTCEAEFPMEWEIRVRTRVRTAQTGINAFAVRTFSRGNVERSSSARIMSNSRRGRREIEMRRREILIWNCGSACRRADTRRLRYKFLVRFSIAHKAKNIARAP